MLHLITSQHRFKARDALQSIALDIAKVTQEEGESDDAFLVQTIESAARAIRDGTLHRSKSDTLARAYALQDFVAGVEDFDKLIDEIDLDFEDE